MLVSCPVMWDLLMAVSSVRFPDMQATSPGTRRLQQAPSLVNAHFQVQAADAGTAVTARDQLQSAANAGSLAVRCPFVPRP